MRTRIAALATLALAAAASAGAVPGRADPPPPSFNAHGELVGAFTTRSSSWDIRLRDLSAQRDLVVPAGVNTTRDEISPSLADDGSRLAFERLLPGGHHRAHVVDLRTGRDITLFRRNLQREHVLVIANALLRPSGTMPADARATLRADAKSLRSELAAAQKRGGYSPEARAHIAEALTMIDEALKAPLVRQAA